MTILSALYVAASLVFALAYVPQIRTLWRDRSGAVSTNLASWAMFSAANIITFLYALQANGDPYFIACTACCMLGNVSVFALAVWRRSHLAPVRVKA